MRKEKVSFVDCKVYCWKCGGLTKLTPTIEGLKPCSKCGAPMLEWYLRKVGLRKSKEAPQEAQNSKKIAQTEQEGISKEKEGLGSYIHDEKSGD